MAMTTSSCGCRRKKAFRITATAWFMTQRFPFLWIESGADVRCNASRLQACGVSLSILANQ
ncbi:MAG: hypothetical protein EBX57_12730 [Betaproteobacteria bacterium]|nr:hypothetical protein [Betaproteobacteria bacterium]